MQSYSFWSIALVVSGLCSSVVAGASPQGYLTQVSSNGGRAYSALETREFVDIAAPSAPRESQYLTRRNKLSKRESQSGQIAPPSRTQLQNSNIRQYSATSGKNLFEIMMARRKARKNIHGGAVQGSVPGSFMAPQRGCRTCYFLKLPYLAVTFRLKGRFGMPSAATVRDQMIRDHPDKREKCMFWTGMPWDQAYRYASGAGLFTLEMALEKKGPNGFIYGSNLYEDYVVTNPKTKQKYEYKDAQPNWRILSDALAQFCLKRAVLYKPVNLGSMPGESVWVNTESKRLASRKIEVEVRPLAPCSKLKVGATEAQTPEAKACKMKAAGPNKG